MEDLIIQPHQHACSLSIRPAVTVRLQQVNTLQLHLTGRKKKKVSANNVDINTSLNLSVQVWDAGEEREKREDGGEQSTFNYSEYPCGVIAACCSNNQQSLFSLPTMKAADAAASLPSYSLCPQSLSWSGTSEKTCKVVHFFQSLQQERIVQEMPSKSDSKWPGKERKGEAAKYFCINLDSRSALF